MEAPAFETVLVRLVELVKDDKELHDAIVRLINASAFLKEVKATRLQEKL